MALVGLLIPDDILKSHRWAVDFCDFMASIIPQIDVVTSIGVKSDVNRFYFSVLWVVSPALVGITVIGSIAGGVNESMIDPLASYWRLLFAAIVVMVGCVYLLSMYHVNDAQKLTHGLLGFPFGRALGGQLVFVNGPIFVLTGTCIMWPYFVFSGKYRAAVDRALRSSNSISQESEL